MTIYDIKYATQETEPYFFSRDTMKFFGQTMRGFRVKKQPDGRYKISAPMYSEGKKMGETVRYYNPQTRKLEHS